MPARFCVVPSPQASEIAGIAREFAAMDPHARGVVVAGDDGYPADLIAKAIADVENPGAVVLTRGGDVFRVLDVDDARNGGLVDLVFAEAWLA
jgi:hypothetical protein